MVWVVVLALEPINVKDSGKVAAKPNPVITHAKTKRSGNNQITVSPVRVNDVIKTAIKDKLLNLLNNSEAIKPEGTPTNVVRPSNDPASTADIPRSISSDGNQFKIE